MTTTLITTNVTTPDRRWTGMARHILCSLPTAAAEREAWLAHVLATAYGARPDMDAVPEAARPYATAAILWHCHEEGYRAAAEQGLSFSDNPYDQVDMHTAWSNGWHTACYHAEQHRRTATLRAHDRWITAFRNGLRAAQEGRNANDCPYQGDEFQAWSHGWVAGRYEQLERLYAAAQRKLAAAEAFAEQINVAFGAERAEKAVLSKQLLELAAEIQHVRRAYQEGMAGAMPGNAHQTAATERDKERDERATLADGYRAASDGKPFKANPIPTTSVALYTK